jgi:hypothetical protein
MSEESYVLERRLRDLASPAERVSLPSGPTLRAVGDGRRRRRRRLGAGVACAIVVAAAVSAGVFWRPTASTTVPASKPPILSPTTTVPPRTTKENTALISSRLNAYVSAEGARESSAGKGSPANLWGNPVIDEQSPPVADGHTYMAVVAFSFDPGGHPVQILSYAHQTWSQVDALAAPTSPGTIYHADALDLFTDNTAIAVAQVTGQNRPDFLIKFAGAGCSSGAIVSHAGTRNGWGYVPFTSPFPTSDVLGGNPQFLGSTLESDNDCTAVAMPAGQRMTWTWFYKPPGKFVGIKQVGWPANP